MQIEVSCETIGRLSRINATLPANEPREWLRSFFVERRNGHGYVGATNSIFAAVQYLGPSEGENGFVLIRHGALPLRAWAECEPETKCTINEISALNYCGIIAPGSYSSSSDVAIRDVEPVNTLKNWREWAPRSAPPAGRAMFLDVDGLGALIGSSPSGRVIFPKQIDAELPVIVRDVTNPDWLGMFLARASNGLFIDGATRPDWSL
ncbi:hypothetical protein HUU40_00360 [candidate division KSB1 bacterium]|nr:hypothetical protein [candidate division KSB1 bacterium]